MTYRQPDVSVAMLTYFHEDYIRQAIDSVLSQETKYTYEIVISDDCSNDNTRKILREYEEEYPQIIRVFYNENNLGISANNFSNRCNCLGRYITPLSGDDYWIDPQKIEKQVSFLDNHPEYFAVVTNVEARQDNNKEAFLVNPTKKTRGKKITLDMYLNGAMVCTHGLMMRNIYINSEGREYFSLLPKASKFIDDSTECLLILNKGAIYSMDFNSVAYRVQSDKRGKHNYNSTNTLLTHTEKMIDLYNYIYKNAGFNIDMFGLYKINVAKAELYMILHFSKKEFEKIYKTVPEEYRRRGMFLRALPYVIYIIMRSLFKRLKTLLTQLL